MSIRRSVTSKYDKVYTQFPYQFCGRQVGMRLFEHWSNFLDIERECRWPSSRLSGICRQIFRCSRFRYSWLRNLYLLLFLPLSNYFVPTTLEITSGSRLIRIVSLVLGLFAMTMFPPETTIGYWRFAVFTVSEFLTLPALRMGTQ